MFKLNLKRHNMCTTTPLSLNNDIASRVGPPRVTLLWGRHYWVCRIDCIEIKVDIMSGHYSQLYNLLEFGKYMVYVFISDFYLGPTINIIQ